MRDNVNETCRNLHFDHKFLEYVKKYRTQMGLNKPKKAKGLFANGVLLQQYLTFKMICTLPENSLQTEHIGDRYGSFLGTSINQPSLARALHALDKLGLVKFEDKHPFSTDERQLEISMTKEGKQMQYLLTGSTKAYPQYETAVTQFRHHANANKSA